jgi:peptidyl-prolyl cis-trans isomerase B (cyclophilin B)
MKKNFPLILIAIFMTINVNAQNTNQVVLIKTSLGDIKVKLYDNTPLHRDNFIKLINEEFYNGTIFHRVINNFMIQGGDPKSIDSDKTTMLGDGGPGYTIPAEFQKENFHKKGALASARLGDAINPEKESSGSQFYIVHGKVYSDNELSQIENRVGIKYSDEQKKIYKTIGGTPFLDGSYTVFGEVLSGLDIVDKIASTKTIKGDRPIEDIKIISISIIK